MKKIIIITGGAGFVGSNLIALILKKTKFQIISYDNYSTGTKKNHINNKRVKYLKGHTVNFSKVFNKFKKKIHSVFHFGEFARIHQSFYKREECNYSNLSGSSEVFNFCLKNKIKLIYSATSASLGNEGKDKNLSPYSFSKSYNIELLENLKKWYNFKFEIIYFYNVYGPNHISRGDMATVIGIFEEAYLNNKPIPVVKPGFQSRRFTHISDTVEVCYFAWKKNKNRHYLITSKESFKIIEIAKLFSKNIIFIKERKGERYKSSLTNKNLLNKVYRKFGKISIRNYIKNFIDKNQIRLSK